MALDGPIPPGAPAPPDADAEVEVPVVWSDDEVIVVDKPAGSGRPSRGRQPERDAGARPAGPVSRTWLDASGRQRPDRPGIVHRLDKGTSGLLMVARTPAARAALTAQLASRQVGPGVPDAGRRDGRVRRRSDRRPARAGPSVTPPGSGSRRVAARLGPVTWSRAATTGRRRRRCCAASWRRGAPTRSGSTWPPSATRSSATTATGGKVVAGWRPLPPGRPFLHAAVLAFDHPVTGERLSFSSPLPGGPRAGCWRLLLAPSTRSSSEEEN